MKNTKFIYLTALGERMFKNKTRRFIVNSCILATVRFILSGESAAGIIRPISGSGSFLDLFLIQHDFLRSLGH